MKTGADFLPAGDKHTAAKQNTGPCGNKGSFVREEMAPGWADRWLLLTLFRKLRIITL